MTQDRIVEALKEHGELSLEELEEKIPLSLSTIKQQLFRLRRRGMIEGTYVYRLKKQGQ